MTREQAIDRANTLRMGKTVCNVLRDKHGRRYAASFKDFDSIGLAKKEVRRKIKEGMPGCVALRNGEWWPPAESELPKIEGKKAA